MDVRIALRASLDIASGEICPIIYLSFDDTAKAFFSDTEEYVSGPGCPAGIDGDADTAVSGILETGRH